MGDGISGYGAARRLNKDLPGARVHLYDRNRWHHCSACGMTFALEGLYPMEDVQMHTLDEYDRMGIDIHEGVEVTGIDLEGRTVQFSDGATARHDVLVLATGRLPADRLVDVGRAYSPPVQLLADPLLVLLEEFIKVKDAMAD